LFRVNFNEILHTSRLSAMTRVTLRANPTPRYRPKIRNDPSWI
jgi:hypothetical protein